LGTYKVRNEIETKRNEINENETKRNEINENETKRNEINDQNIFYLACFNCDLILIEHRNKHIVTFFWTIGTHCNFLISDRHFGCKVHFGYKVVLSASFLKSDTGKNYKTSKKTIVTTRPFFLPYK
jgi:hypothetical protein